MFGKPKPHLAFCATVKHVRSFIQLILQYAYSISSIPKI